MSKINRKTIVVTSLVVLLVITSYINYQFNQPDDQSASLPQATPSAVTSTDTAQGEGNEDTQEAAAQAVGFKIAEYKAERETVRKTEIEHLDQIINDDQTDQATLKSAQEQKMGIVSNMEKEVTIEGLLQAKGFEQTVVSLHDESANVIVKQDGLTSAQVAQIVEVVQRESSQKPENIKIIPAK